VHGCKGDMDCARKAMYGDPGGRGERCRDHMTAGMINVTDRRCAGFKEDGTACGGLKPAFDEAGGKGTYCVTHKSAGMENVKSKRCEGVDEGGSPCTTHANFNAPGQRMGRFCSSHKAPGMESVTSVAPGRIKRAASRVECSRCVAFQVGSRRTATSTSSQG
jgi:hypothetical protein